MDGAMKRFAVAVRRQFRNDSDIANLAEVFDGIDGVRVAGITGAHAEIEATDEAASQLRARLGDRYLIEELVERHTC
jgi:hypothetical protein